MQTEIGQRKKREKRMIAYKCAKCGAGELEPLGDGKKAVCQYCFSVMVLPTLDPEAFNRATELRQQLQFDQAEMALERIRIAVRTENQKEFDEAAERIRRSLEARG